MIVIPTAMHISAVDQISKKLLPSLSHLKAVLENKEKEFLDIVKTGPHSLNIQFI